jgi:hypothetical protein
VSRQVLRGTGCEGLTGGDSGLPKRPFPDRSRMQCFQPMGAKKRIPRFDVNVRRLKGRKQRSSSSFVRPRRCQAGYTRQGSTCSSKDSQRYGYLDLLCIASGANGNEQAASIVQHNAQQGAVNLQTVFIVDEAQFLELVHKQVHAGTRRANHFR